MAWKRRAPVNESELLDKLAKAVEMGEPEDVISAEGAVDAGRLAVVRDTVVQ